jgi:hypothetical protein
VLRASLSSLATTKISPASRRLSALASSGLSVFAPEAFSRQMDAPNPSGVGGFRPGQSGNPGGRPQSVSAIQLAARRHCLEAIERLADIMRNGGPDAPAKIAACRELLDRGFGRPAQSIDLAVSARKQILEMDADQLAAAERHLLAERGAIEQALIAAPATAALAVIEEQEREEQEQASLLDRMESGGNGNGGGRE